MEEKPYFCPNCRSNRIKFSVVTSFSRRILKDAHTGAILESSEPQVIEEPEPNIECMVCHFIGNEMRFVKQAEREPRSTVSAAPYYG